jgi:hypothetical protein
MATAIKQYDFPDIKRNSTFNARVFTVNVNGDPLDLTGAEVFCTFRAASKTGIPKLKLSTLDSSITLSDPTAGKFRLEKIQNLALEAGQYFYDILIIMPNGDRKAYIEGTLRVIQNVSNNA